MNVVFIWDMYEEKEKNKDIIKSITAVLLNYTCPNVKSKKVKKVKGLGY